MPKYKTKPVVIEAIRVDEILEDAASSKGIPRWLRSYYEKGDLLLGSMSLELRTSGARITAGSRDWIIRGFEGEISSMSDEEFKKTYTKEDQDEDPKPPKEA